MWSTQTRTGYLAEPDPFRIVFAKNAIIRQSPIAGWLLLQGANSYRWLNEMAIEGVRLDGWLKDKACWAWTGCEGLTVKIADDEAAAQWSQLLGEPVMAGQTVALDGRLTDPVKRRIFAKDVDLAVWILRRADELARKYDKREKRLLGN